MPSVSPLMSCCPGNFLPCRDAPPELLNLHAEYTASLSPTGLSSPRWRRVLARAKPGTAELQETRP